MNSSTPYPSNERVDLPGTVHLQEAALNTRLWIAATSRQASQQKAARRPVLGRMAGAGTGCRHRPGLLRQLGCKQVWGTQVWGTQDASAGGVALR